MEMEDDKRDLISREISKFRDTHKVTYQIDYQLVEILQHQKEPLFNLFKSWRLFLCPVTVNHMTEEVC